ncbi:hypothetical protein CN311_03215 [Mesorhizobium sanjuanii]|uniref:Transposase n=1 Tax=Mesorhizobium sanjuanii TaxID=2037900 RepID=A0A2A6FLQ9_9HYPH|nr:hypothetical protein CN311_03215 [Mesorhizobium sanjuanii]
MPQEEGPAAGGQRIGGINRVSSLGCGPERRVAGWPISRRRPSAIPSDLTHEEWSRIQPFLPGAAKTGRRVATELREGLNAIRYKPDRVAAGACCQRISCPYRSRSRRLTDTPTDCANWLERPPA